MTNPLREWREELGLTQVEVSRGAGVLQSTLSALEAGKGCSGDSMARLIRYSKNQGVPLDPFDLVSDKTRAKPRRDRRVA